MSQRSCLLFSLSLNLSEKESRVLTISNYVSFHYITSWGCFRSVNRGINQLKEHSGETRSMIMRCRIYPNSLSHALCTSTPPLMVLHRIARCPGCYSVHASINLIAICSSPTGHNLMKNSQKQRLHELIDNSMHFRYRIQSPQDTVPRSLAEESKPAQM